MLPPHNTVRHLNPGGGVGGRGGAWLVRCCSLATRTCQACRQQPITSRAALSHAAAAGLLSSRAEKCAQCSASRSTRQPFCHWGSDVCSPPV